MARGKSDTKPAKGRDVPDETNPYDVADPPGYIAANIPHEANREKRWIWIARISLAMNSLLAMTILALGVAIAQLTPLKEVVPFMVGYEADAKGIFTIRPLEPNYALDSPVSEGWIMRYVREREEIIANPALLRARWEDEWYFLRVASSDEVWAGFQDHAGHVLNVLEQTPINRLVEIESIELKANDPPTYQVIWQSTDYVGESFAAEPGRTIGADPADPKRATQRKWVTVVSVERTEFEHELPLEYLEINPLLQIVTDYETLTVGR